MANPAAVSESRALHRTFRFKTATAENMIGVLKVLTLIIAIPTATLWQCQGFEPSPAAQYYRQEFALSLPDWVEKSNRSVQLIEILPNGTPGAFAHNTWFGYQQGTWQKLPQGKALKSDYFYFFAIGMAMIETDIPADEVLQLLRSGPTNWVLTTTTSIAVMTDGTSFRLQLPGSAIAAQLAVSPEGRLFIATTIGLFEWRDNVWKPVEALDGFRRDWARRGVLGVSFDSHGQLWIATKAGVGCHSGQGWQFFYRQGGAAMERFHRYYRRPERRNVVYDAFRSDSMDKRAM